MDNKSFTVKIRTHTMFRDCDRMTTIYMSRPDLIDVVADSKTIAYNMLAGEPITLLVVDISIFDENGRNLYDCAVGERYSWGESR